MPTVNQVMVNISLIKVPYEAKKAIEKNLGSMLLMNLGQLYKGEDTEKNPFKEYAPYEIEDGRQYSEMKHAMNPIPGEGNPDLKLSGSFYKKMYAILMGGNIIIDSGDSKAEMLTDKYGGEDGKLIFGLQQDNMEMWQNEFVAKDFQKSIEALTGLKFS